MLAVLPVLLLVPWLLWRYRYRKTPDDYAPDWDESRKLDVVMWGVPFAIIAILGVLLWRSTTMLDPYRPIPPAAEATRVQVVGLDWKWLFIYPEQGIATVGELIGKGAKELLKLRNFGQKSYLEIEDRLSSIGLSLNPKTDEDEEEGEEDSEEITGVILPDTEIPDEPEL